MGSKTINTILNMQDRMSPKLVKVSGRVKELDKNTQRATQRMANMANMFSTSVTKMAGKAAKLTLIGASMAGAFALKTGLSEAFDLEGYKMQLETATKSSKKAGEIMKYAIDLANKTPFEGGELVEGAAKLEAMGMAAKEWLPKIGDMAAATNKPFDQAVEAVIDAQTGELERLKEFGITKAKIVDQGNKMFKGKELVNKKGQITDQKRFNEAMVAVMKDRFTGGMVKQSETVKGLWSTVTGTTKSALSTIVGMQMDGTIKQGSLLDTLKGKIKTLAEQFDKWQKNGTIDSISKKFTEGFEKMCVFADKTYNFIKKVFDFVVKHQEIILFLVTFTTTIMVVIKAVAFLKTAISGLSLIFAIMNGALALTPFGMIAIAIGLVVAAGVLLYRNWDFVKQKAIEFKDKIIEIWQSIKDFLAHPLKGTVDLVSNTIDAGKGNKQTVANRQAGRHALGTSYAKGGLSSINERGGEIIDLPNGSRVIPADKSAKMINNSGGNVFNINVNGVGKSTDEIINEFVPKLKLALANM